MKMVSFDGYQLSGRIAVAASDEHYSSPHPIPPLPLAQPTVYWNLVKELYSTSAAIILGNMLEWLDFGIYGYSESEISQQLFAGSTAAGWATFGLGYSFRPVGAYLLGRLSDNRSRKLSFIIAMLGMALSTAIMSIVPAVCATNRDESANGAESTLSTSYCTSKVWMSALPVVCLRAVQGFSAGAAAGGINVMQSELWSTRERKGAIAQSVGVNNVSGAAASTISAAIVFGLRAALGQIRYAVWGWRVAFLTVIPPSLGASYLMHTSLPESNEYASRDDDAVDPVQDDGHGDSFHDEAFVDESLTATEDYQEPVGTGNMHSTGRTPLWLLISLSIYIQFAIAAYNNLNVYLVQYAEDHYGLTANSSTLMAVVGKAVQVLITPLAALIADIYGWFFACALGGILCAALAMPMMAASSTLGGSITTIWILVTIVFPTTATIWILNAPLLATSIFPVEFRSKGTSLVMATGTAMAGFFPLVLNEVQSIYASGAVLAVVAAVAATGILCIRDRAKNGRVSIYQRPELF